MTMAILPNIIFHGRDSACSLWFQIGQTIRLFYIIVVLAFIVTLQGQISTAQPPVMCNGGFSFANGSKFESNMNTVLNSLVQNTSQTGFNTSVYGKSPDEIYGLLQCREDATAQQCYNCSQQAITNIRQICGNAGGARIWLDICFLRFENGSFFGKMDTFGHYLPNPQNVSSPAAFNAALEKLFNSLSVRAASGSARFASGTTIDSLSRRIYGLVQCWRDISSDDCTKCLSNAFNKILTSYAGSQGVEAFIGSCEVRYETYSFFDSTAPPAPSPATATPAPSPASTQINHLAAKISNKMPIILVAVGGLLLLLLIVCLFACGRRLKSARRHEGPGQVEEDTLLSDRQKVFKMKTLVAATANFHDDNKLGEGGFGPVYKGITQDGKQIAVKKLSLKSTQGRKEFLNEVKLVAQIQHRNLVNLLGCCAEKSERLLVYEYLPNKSLDKILFDSNRSKELDWQTRYNIILGVARGLLYLHQDSQLRIVHRDIKASNILLDEKLNPKIADFGLAKLFSDDKTLVTTQVAGTLGYIAPEYALRGQLSVKVDVYSFGVVLLELMTGRKNTDYTLPSEMEILLGWVWSSYKRGNIVQTIDPAIMETCDEEQALRCIHVGLLCTQADPSLRPPMFTVTMMLSTHSVTLPEPQRPAYVTSVTHNTNSIGSRSGLSHERPPTFSSVSSSPFHTPLAPSIADSSITILIPR